MHHEKHVQNGPISPLSSISQEGSFLQSKTWADFQQAAGHSSLEVSSTRGSVYAYRYVLSFGMSYLYVPHGEVSESVLEGLIKEGKRVGDMFLRIEPLSEPVPTSGGSLVPVASRQPQYSLIVPITKEEDMLRQMHSKTRYNIGLSERKEVVVKKEKNIDVFWSLLSETTKRDGFRSHDKIYYKNMLDMPSVEQYVAYTSHTPIASIITIRFGSVVTYLHGASLHEYRNLMAPYALQWTALKEAYASGALWYDMWGVAPPAPLHSAHAETFHAYTWDTRHSFHGITRFKAGFGGVAVEHPSTAELPLRPWLYRLYRLRKRFFH